jgi:glycosyltransferase involved in cell wall biosynthesis
MRVEQTVSKACPRLGVVVIGRNEGDRLKRCIESVADEDTPVVYVDSGSSDGSPEWARARGCEVVDLDHGTPFTAARARNAGLEQLQKCGLDLLYVQFVDGDCELFPAWLSAAVGFLGQHEDVVVVGGRLRERRPEASIYNRLCDVEWDTPIGEARSCGGIAMYRIAALSAANGFREGLIAGEEPELCVRLRAAGGRIWRLDADMAWHDVAMTRLGQWWRRTKRAGHAFAEGAALHGAPPERHYVKEARRALTWGLALPIAALLGAFFHGACALVLLAYPMQIVRLSLRHRADGRPSPGARAFFLVLGRFPEALGVCTYWLRRWRRAPVRLIEYK